PRRSSLPHPLPLSLSPLRAPSPFSFSLTDTSTTAIYSLSLHDALPIYAYRYAGAIESCLLLDEIDVEIIADGVHLPIYLIEQQRSEEHTSELQSRENLVCRLLLEKKKET